MINIIVQRPPADNQGPDVSNDLISNEAVARMHGTALIDENCSDRVLVSGSMPLHSYIEPGTLVQVTDLQIGQYIGIVKSFAVSCEAGPSSISAITNIVIERVK